MLQMSATWPSPKKLPVDKEVCYLCGQAGHVVWPRGVSEGAETPQEQLEPLNVTSVMVAAVRPSAATIWGKIGDKKVEIMLDSGSSISLIQESIVTPFLTRTRYHHLDYSSHQLQVTIFRF